MESQIITDVPAPVFNDKPELTPIQEFYSGTNIFITGGTGFLGKILIQKLLTSCPEIETIYLLVRNKKGKDMHTRIEEIFDDVVFKQMKAKVPKYRHRIQGIAGDCLVPGLGLSPSDREILVNRVNIIFHMAATVRFDEKLGIALKINIMSCKDILQLSSEAKNIKSVIHVSTAYTQCVQKVLKEEFYPPQMDPLKLGRLGECTSDSLLDLITPILLDKYPNTYAFTKSLGEDIVRRYGVGQPVGMFRPGIVLSTYREPIPAWVDNFYGPTGAIAAAGAGIMRTLHCDSECDANLVPVDMVVNGIIACAWDTHNQYQSKLTIENEIPIYNYCTEQSNRINWGTFTTKTAKSGVKYPTLKAIWYLSFANQKSKFIHTCCMIFLHYVPAMLVDAFALLIGKKPRLTNTYRKIHHFMKVIEYFSTREWIFETTNVQKVWSKLSDKDKDQFFFDMKKLDWDVYLSNYFKGVRQYLLNDPLDTLVEARKRWNRLYWLHQSVKFFVSAILLKTVWSFFSMFIRH